MRGWWWGWTVATLLLVTPLASAAPAGFSPTITGMPAWGDGSKCSRLPSGPESALSIRFLSPAGEGLEGVFLHVPGGRRGAPTPARVELRSDIGGKPGDDVLASADVVLPRGRRRWVFVPLGEPLLMRDDAYHLVFHATAGRSRTRVCHLWHRDGATPRTHPWTVLERRSERWEPVHGASGWLEPVFLLRLTGGVLWGQPYWTARAGRSRRLFAYRELETDFRPAADVRVSGVHARLDARAKGSALRFKLVGPRGALLREGRFVENEHGPWPSGYAAALHPPLDLDGGSLYLLVIHAPDARSAGAGFRYASPLTELPTLDALPGPGPLRGAARSIPPSRGRPSPTAPVMLVTEAACGNGVVDQPSERCDGRDDVVCPGTCRADCTCGLAYPTANLAPAARVTASSEDVELEAVARNVVDGVVDGVPGSPLHEWAALAGTRDAWVRLEWDAPVTVDRVVLHDRPGIDNLLGATLMLDDTESIPIGALPPDGTGAEIVFDPTTLFSLTLMLQATAGTSPGLSEIEVVAADASRDAGGDDDEGEDGGGADDGAGDGDGGSDDDGGGDDGGGGTYHTYYVSPTGNDSASGTSASEAWRTFGRVFNSRRPLAPGDTLVLLDGTYRRETTGLVRIDCGPGGNARNGSRGERVTIRAANERRAALVSDGLEAPFEMKNCSWWHVEGLRAENKDNPSGSQAAGFPFRFHEVSHVKARRLLGSHNNRMQNTHVFAVENSRHVLLEECEAYYFHRHAFSIWRSRFVTIRRSYANSMQYGTRGCCSGIDNRDYGDEAFSLYGTSDSIIENCVSENQANGYQIHGIRNDFDPSGHGGRNNRVLGSVSFGDSVPALVSSRSDGPSAYHNARGNLFRDFVAASMVGNGLYLRDAADSRIENVTLVASTQNSGLAADQTSGDFGGTCSATLICTRTGAACSDNADCAKGVCTSNPDGCSFRAANVLSLDHRSGSGVTATRHDWLVEHSNASGSRSDFATSESIDDDAGSVRRSSRIASPEIGLRTGQCLLWIPEGSPMRGRGKAGADIGANVLYRYVNGTLTGTPLWDPETGTFPCGAVVRGINDGDTRCTSLHARLNVDRNGCSFPPDYGR